MVKYVPFSCFKVCSKLELGSKGFTSISTLTLVNVKEKKGGGRAVVRLPRDGLVVSQHGQTVWIVITDDYDWGHSQFWMGNRILKYCLRYSKNEFIRDESFATSVLDGQLCYDTRVSSRFSLLTMTVCSIASNLQLVCFIHELGAGTVMGKTCN